MQRKMLALSLILFVFVLVQGNNAALGASEPPEVPSDDFNGHLILGAQYGVTQPPVDVVSNISNTNTDVISGAGMYGSLSAMYGMSSHAMLGIDVDYNTLPIYLNVPKLSFARSSTISVFPMLEVRGSKYHNFSFYGTLGLGANFNTFSTGTSLGQACGVIGTACQLSPSYSFAVRIAVGMDYFVTQNTALNLEIGYLVNQYTNTSVLQTVSSAPETVNETVNLSTLFFLLGIHYRI